MSNHTPISLIQMIKAKSGADFSHNGSTQSIASNTWTKLLNDTVGAYTNETSTPLGAPTLYDRTNNRISLEPYPVGSLLGIRLDAVITPIANAQIDCRIHWQAKDDAGNNTFNFQLTRTLGYSLAGKAYYILEPFELTIDGEQQRQGYIEVQIYVAGTTATLQMNGIKIYKK